MKHILFSLSLACSLSSTLALALDDSMLEAFDAETTIDLGESAAAAAARAAAVAAQARIAVAEGKVAPAVSNDYDFRTYEGEALNKCPTRSRCYGQAVVEDVVSSGQKTRAVRVHDTDTKSQARVLLLGSPLPAKVFEFDLLLKSTSTSTIIAVHGTGADEKTGTWRFLIQPNGNSKGSIAVWDGEWTTLGTVAGLHDSQRWTHFTITASTNVATIDAGGSSFTTSAKADIASNITSLEVASSGTASTGTDTYIDGYTATEQVENAVPEGGDGFDDVYVEDDEVLDDSGADAGQIFSEEIGQIENESSDGKIEALSLRKKKTFVGIPRDYIYRKNGNSVHDYCTASPDEFPAPRAKNANFRGPCARHDMCLERGGKLKRYVCDAKLAKDLVTNCNYQYGITNPLRYACQRTAAFYWQVVTVKTSLALFGI